MVFYHVGRTEDLRDSLNTGLLPVTRTLLGAAGSGVASLARKLGPRDPGEVVELIDDVDPPGWTPAKTEEVA